jgi:hypothetical protein
MPTSVGKQLKQFNLFYAAHISLFNLWFPSLLQTGQLSGQALCFVEPSPPPAQFAQIAFFLFCVQLRVL